jgi:hypothetical protein
VVQWIAGLAVILFVARAVIRRWDEVRAAPLDWAVSPLRLVGAVLVIWLAFALLAEAWRRMVAAWGRPLPWRPAARIWLLASMAKYLPGKVWSLAGLALLGERAGVPAWAAAGSALLLQVLAIGTGALVVGVAGTASLDLGSAFGKWGLVALGAASAAVTALALWPPVTRRLVAVLAPGADPVHVPGLKPLVFGAAANLVAWCGYGLALWFFAHGTLEAVDLGLGAAIGSFTAAYLAGVIAPFAPGGLGVREGVLVLVLRDQTGLGPALALAAVSRLGFTLAEIVATLPFLTDRGETPGD